MSCFINFSSLTFFLFLYLSLQPTLLTASQNPIRARIKLDPTGTDIISKACSHGAGTLDHLDCDLFLEDAPQHLKTSAKGFTEYTLGEAEKLAASLSSEAKALINSSMKGEADQNVKNALSNYCVRNPKRATTILDDIKNATDNLSKNVYPKVMESVKGALLQADDCRARLKELTQKEHRDVALLVKVDDLKNVLSIAVKLASLLK